MSMGDQPPRGPIPVSYWVKNGRLLAGEYPGALDHDEAVAKVARICAAGIKSFIDLTEDHGRLKQYDDLLDAEIRYRRMQIRDNDCPTAEEMRETLNLIDEELAHGRNVYVHCWGGHGRTGTVIGCWLVRHGLSGDEALDRIRWLRRAIPPEEGPSPQTWEQIQMVRGWQEEA